MNARVLSWNVQGKINFTGHTPFNKILPYLLISAPDVIVLQEMCDAELKLNKLPNLLKEYKIYIPEFNTRKRNGNCFNHNVILSKHPVLEFKEIHFPQLNPGVFLESASRADIKINDSVLRIYNCHFGIFRSGIATRIRQLEHILLDAKKYQGPTVICGDLNVTIPKKSLLRHIISLWHQEPKSEMTINGKLIIEDEREIFNKIIVKHGFKEVFNLYTPTWSPFKSKMWELFCLKLDWFVIKNAEVADARLGDYFSDHRPMEVQLLLDTTT